MANKKISELPAASSVTVDDILPIVDITTVETQKATISQVIALVDVGVTSVAADLPLAVTGSPNAPTVALSGTIPVDHGGTGVNSLSGHGALVMNPAGTAVTTVHPSTAGRVLISDGTNWVSGTAVTSITGDSTVSGLSLTGGPITTTGTLTLSGTLDVAGGGTGAASLTGYVKGTGTTAFTASATIPGSDISGDISGNAANVTGVVDILNGGTGETSKAAAFDALSPLGAIGDLITFDGTDNVSFPVGTDNQVLTADSSQPLGLRWADAGLTGSGQGLQLAFFVGEGTSTELSSASGTGSDQLWWSNSFQTLLVRSGGPLSDGTVALQVGGRVAVPRGSAAAPSFTFYEDLSINSGVFSPAENQVAVSTNGVQRLNVTTSGITVGEGLTNYTLPLTRGSDGQVLQTNGSGTVSWATVSGGGGTPASPTGSVQFNNAGAFGGSANLFWDNTGTGKLGVGTNTPLAALHSVATNAAAGYFVGGTLGGSSATLEAIGDISGSNFVAQVAARSSLSNGTARMIFADTTASRGQIQALQDTAGGNSGRLEFYTSNVGGTRRFVGVFDSSGRFGVGTSSPASVINAEGAATTEWIRVNSTAAGAGFVDFYSSGTAGFQGPSAGVNTGTNIPFKINTSGTTRATFATNSTGAIFNPNSNDYDFRVQSQGNANMLFVDASANAVGIGTASPGAVVDIQAGTTSSAAPGLRVQSTSSGAGFNYNNFISVTSGVVGNSDKALEVSITGAPSLTYGAFGIFVTNATTSTVNSYFTNGGGPVGVRGDSTGVNGSGVQTGASLHGNVGVLGNASGSVVNVGVAGVAPTAENNHSNVGVVGTAANTGSGTAVAVGGLFTVSTATGSPDPSYGASAALIADNQDTSFPIFLARDGGTSVFKINDGGSVTIGQTGTSYTLPTARGTNGQVLQTDGSGGVTWQTLVGVTDGDKGDITVASSGTSWTVDTGVITNSKLASVATATFKGRSTAGTGSPEDLTATQATALLNTFTSTLKGLAPSSGGGTTNFLRADGTWTAPPGAGMAIGDSITDATENSILFAGASGVLAQNNAGLFWNNGTSQLGVDGVVTANGVTIDSTEGLTVGSTSPSVYQSTVLAGISSIIVNDYAIGNGTFFVISNVEEGNPEPYITGIAGGVDGRIIHLLVSVNSPTPITLLSEDALSVAENRLSLGAASTSISQDTVLSLIYDGTTQRWKRLATGGTIGVTGGGTGTTTQFATGSVVFAGAFGVYSQDINKFFYNSANNRLGLGTNNPGARLDTGDGDVLINGITVGRGGGAISNCVAVGQSALSGNTGSQNTAVGNLALYSNSGSRNVAVGSLALSRFPGPSSYNDCVAVGHGALQINDSGSRNVAVGSKALGGSFIATDCVAVGESALLNSVQSNNTAVGSSAAKSITNGNSNVAIGASAFSTATLSSQVVAVGYLAANDVIAGIVHSNSVAVGYNAQVGSQVGSGQNTSVGALAGNTLTTGFNNTTIGYDAQPTTATTTNEVVLGNNSTTTFKIGRAAPSAPNPGFTIDQLTVFGGPQPRVNIGHSSFTASAPFIRFLINGGNGTGAAITQNGVSPGFPVLYANGSDYRLKKDVEALSNSDALSRLLSLRPVRFHYTSQDDGPLIEGFIAHEVQEVIPQAVTHHKDAVDAEGNPQYQGIDQSHLVPVLTAACKELASKLTAAEARADAAEARLAALEAAVAALQNR